MTFTKKLNQNQKEASIRVKNMSKIALKLLCFVLGSVLK